MSDGAILLLVHDLGVGGMQRKIAETAEGLAAPGVTVTLALKERPPGAAAQRVFYEAVKASQVRIRYRPRGVPFVLLCFWCVLEGRPDRIIGFLRGEGIIAVMLRALFFWRDIRVGVSEDSFPSGSIAGQTRSSAHAALIRWLARRAYARADWIVVPTDAARVDLVMNLLVPNERVVVIPNWVLPETGAGGAGRETGENTSPGFDLVCASRLVQVKNLSLFLQILRDICDVMPSVRAAIVGGGPMLPELEKERARLSLEAKVVFAGWRRDVRPWLAASRVYCITSDHEGMPLAALEAMALGLPVVALHYPGVEELVRNGETGFVCAHRQEFVNRVIECLTNESARREMGMRSAELVAVRHGVVNLRQFERLMSQG